MKKLALVLLAVMTLNVSGKSTELPKVNESKIELESWMTQLFIGEPSIITGVDKTGKIYKISLSEDVYHFNGKIYNIYQTNNIKIAVYKDSYIVIDEDVLIFYGYTKDIFGIQKIMFSKPEAKDGFNIEEYSKQSKLHKGKENEKFLVTMIVENYFLLKRI